MLIKNPSEMTRPLVCTPIDSDWKESIQNNWWGQDHKGNLSEQLKNNRKLISHILSFGGEEVCMPTIEEDLNKILKRGGLLYGDNIDFIEGRPSQCHANSALIWNDDKERIQIMTGYALSVDGMWRQHSWCIYTSDGQIIETTEERVAYFGFILNEEEAEEFFDNNSW